MKNKSVRTEVQKSFLWNFKLYAFIGCLAFPLNVLGESVSFDTDNVAFMSPSQRIKVTGIVKDEAGITLPGVNVVVKGTIIGTITDANGQFTLEAPSDGVLLFTYVGFGNLELPVNGKENLEIIMKEGDTQLEEVVVVGYGTQKKVSVVGSISNIAPKAIKQTATTSLPNALSGRMPGIITRQTSGEPGFDEASIYIRGIATWGEKAPLVLVDGIERSISSVNPDEVESLSVLKDASATAVYGVKGANGVILINTKRGKQGKPQVSFRTESAILSSLAERNYIDGYEYASLMNEGLANVGKAPRWSNEELEKFRTGSDPYLYPNVDWIDKIYKNVSSVSNVNLNISGGSDLVRYYLSASFYNQGGQYNVKKENGYDPNLNYKRYDFRSNVDVNITKTTLLQMNLSAIMTDSRYPGIASNKLWYEAFSTSPVAFPVRYPDGRWAGPPANAGSNPMNEVQNSGYTDTFRPALQSVFTVNQKLDFITKGLSAYARFSFDSYSEFNNKRTGGVDLWYTNQRDGNGELVFGKPIKEGSDELYYEHSDTGERVIYTEANISYDRTFGHHNVNGMVLYNMRNRMIATAGSAIASIPYRNQAIAARFGYGYKERYLAEVNGSYTGSENFAPGHRFGFFPAASVGWVISNEPFFKNMTRTVDLLKLRASYGIVGNDNIGKHGYQLFAGTRGQRHLTSGIGIHAHGQELGARPCIYQRKIGRTAGNTSGR